MDDMSNTAWQMYSNGFSLSLVIGTIDASSGKIQGSFIEEESTGRQILENAVWNETTKQISFTRVLSYGETQHYIGYRFDKPVSLEQQSLAILAGSFDDDFLSTVRTKYGWFAYYVSRAPFP